MLKRIFVSVKGRFHGFTIWIPHFGGGRCIRRYTRERPPSRSPTRRSASGDIGLKIGHYGTHGLPNQVDLWSKFFTKSPDASMRIYTHSLYVLSCIQTRVRLRNLQHNGRNRQRRRALPQAQHSMLPHSGFKLPCSLHTLKTLMDMAFGCRH